MAIETDWSEVIDQHAPPEDIIKALADALDADTYTREGKVVPDHRTRLAAAQTLLMHRRGRPTEAPEPKRNGGDAGGKDLLELLSDPEYAAKVEAALAAAKAKTR